MLDLGFALHTHNHYYGHLYTSWALNTNMTSVLLGNYLCCTVHFLVWEQHKAPYVKREPWPSAQDLPWPLAQDFPISHKSKLNMLFAFAKRYHRVQRVAAFFLIVLIG